MNRKTKICRKIVTFFLGFLVLAGIPAWANPVDFKTIEGTWARMDGNYTLHVRNVNPQGTAEVSYHNPGIVHVAESRFSTQDGLIRLLVKLDDKGYPGSTYTLYYYAEHDVLAGVYYQALQKQSYEVVFVRK